MVNLDNLKNLYEVRKTVRFELKPYKKTREILKWASNYYDLDSYIKHIKEWDFEEWFDWNKFCAWEYKEFLESSRQYFEFLKEINNEIQKKKYDTTKKQIFFDFKKSKGIFKNIPSLKKVQWFESLKPKLEEVQTEYDNCFNFFEQLEKTETSNQKKSDISIYLRKIAYLNRSLFTIFGFLDPYQTDNEIYTQYEKLGNGNFVKLNNSIIASHENEVSWACFGKITFNKFALFRREAEILKEKFEKNKQILEKSVNDMLKDWDIITDNWKKININFTKITELTLKKKNSDLQKRLENFNFDRTLDEVISELDDINGILLNQYIQDFKKQYKKDQNIINFDENNLNLSIEWHDRGVIKIQHNQIQTLEWHKYLYLLLQEEITDENKEKKKLLNKFLKIIFKQKFINPDYNTIKEIRDTLAKHRWKLRQNVRTSEREFIQEAMIRYYGQILEKDGNYFVALFVKEQLDNDIKNILTEKEMKNESDEKDCFKIYKYSQLSFSALEKLCLSKDWDLLVNENLQKLWDRYKNQKKEISEKCKTYYEDYKKHQQETRWNCKECKELTETKKKRFFDDFKEHIKLALKKLKNDEKYKGEDWSFLLDKLEQQDSIEAIVSFINHKFYKLEKKYIDSKMIFELAESWKVLLFQVYNKDFNIYNDGFVSEEEKLNDKEKYCWEVEKVIEKTKRKSWKQENLFTKYFRNIFQNSEETFLGQEANVFFRKADEESDKKRFRNDKFFIGFDIIFNKWKDISKAKMCEKKEIIQSEKRKKLNEITKQLITTSSGEIKNNVIFVWIDRWQKEHLSIGFYNSNLEFEWIIWNTNFVKKIKDNWENFEILFKPDLTYFEENEEKDIYKQIQLNHFYFNEKGEEEAWKYLELLWLKDFHVKKIFQQDKEWIFFTELKNWWKFILNKWIYWYTILDKDWEEIKLLDRLDNREVIDYYLLFESERYKRILDINTELQYANNMKNLKKWYIAIIKDYLKRQVRNLHKKGKQLVFVFENQSTNKWKSITNVSSWASIISDIEHELLNSFSYLLYKDETSLLNWIQLWINVKKEDLISLSKKGNPVNQKYEMFAYFLFVNPDYTSEACPICNELDIKDKPYILYGHGKWKQYENSMHHINDKNNENFQDWKWKSGTLSDWTTLCDYHIRNEKYPEFKFIQSWDDLATYNIAKKAKEYLESLPTFQS